MDATVSSETLAIIIAAKDEASAALARIGTELDALNGKVKENAATNDAASFSVSKFGSEAEKLGRNLSTYVTLPIVGVGLASADMAMKFQQSMTYIKTDAGDMTDDIGKLSQQVLELAKNSQFSPDQLANGLYHLASLGLRGAEAMNALNTAQKMAAVGGADLESTTSALGAALVTGIKGVQDYNQAAGVLDATIGAGNMRMQDLVGALGTGVLPVFKNAGLSIIDFGAALATLTDNGMDASMAATRLRMTISLMESPSKGAATALKEIGMSANQLGMDMQTKGLIPALQDLQNHLIATYGTTAEGKQKIAEAMTQIFGGGRSSGAVQTLVDQLGRLQTKYQQISDQSGEFADKYAQQQQTAAFKIKNAWATIQADAIQLGGAILPQLAQSFSHLANAISDVVNWFNHLDEPNKKLIISFLEILATVGPVLLIVGKVIRIFRDMKILIMESIIPALSTLAGSFASLWTVITGGSLVADAVNPIFAIITVIMLLALAIYEIVTHWSKVKAWIMNFWEDNKRWIIAFLAVFEPEVLAIGFLAYEIIKHWSQIKEFFHDLWTVIKHDTEAVIDWFKELWNDPWKAMLQFLNNVNQWTKDLDNAILKGLEAFGDLLLDGGKWLVKKIREGWDDAVADAKHWAYQLLIKIIEGTYDLVTDAPTVAKNIYKSIKNGWNEEVGDAKTWGKDLLKNIENSIDQYADEAKSVTHKIWLKMKDGWQDSVTEGKKIGKSIMDAIFDGINMATPKETAEAGKDSNTILKKLGIDPNAKGAQGAIINALKPMLQFDVAQLLDWKAKGVELWQHFYNMMKEGVKGAKQSWDDNWKDAKNWTKNAVNSIKQGWDDNWKDTKTWIKNTVNGIKKSWDEEWKDAKNWGHNIVNEIKKGWDEQWKDAKNWVKQVYNDVKKSWDDNWKDVKNWGHDISHNIAEGAKENVKDIKDFFHNLPKLLEGDAKQSGHDTANHHQQGMKDHWLDPGNIKKIGDAIWKAILLAIAAVLAAIILAVVAMVTSMIDAFVHTMEWLQGKVNSAVRKIYHTVVDALSDAGTWLWDTGVKIIDGLVRGIESVVGRVSSTLKKIGSNVAGDVKGALHAAHIPGFASGVRNYIGGYAMVGENGPEMVYLPPGSNVYNSGQTQGMLNSNNTATVTIGTVVLQDASAVQEFFKKIDQDNILTGMGLTPNRGMR